MCGKAFKVCEPCRVKTGLICGKTFKVYEPRHVKTGPRISFIVISKEGQMGQ